LETLKNRPVVPYVVHALSRTGDWDHKSLISNIAGLILAAVDTTAHAMSWLLYHLARTPQAQDDLFQELSPLLNGGPLLKHHMKDVTYLKACLKESSRITPVTGAHQRTINSDLIAQGYLLPAGTFIEFSSVPFCLDETVFPNPQDFDPKRWINNTSNNHPLHDHPLMVSPFGFGPRMCVGARVAEMEIMALFAVLVQKYRIELAPDSPIPQAYSIGSVRPLAFPKYKFHKR